MSTRSPAKIKLIEFLRATKDGDPFTFEMVGNESNAKTFVAGMRTELSRMRQSVAAAGKTLNKFKVIVEGMEEFTPPGGIVHTRVTLRKQQANEVDQTLALVFNELVVEAK
jgi:hypothetical protein